MLIIIGSAVAAPGRRDQLIGATRDVAAATRGDDGCVSYGFYTDVLDEDTVVGVEIWRDQAALDAHMAHDHTQRFLSATDGAFAGEPRMDFYTATATG